MRYSHTQRIPGKVMTLGSIAGIAIGLSPPGFLARLALLGVLGGVALTFRSLTVEVDDDSVSFWFGDGLVKKSYLLSNVASAGSVRTTPRQGWGIHWIGSGWLYNIYGLDAVALRFKDGKQVFIGTDEPEALAGAINEGIESKA